MYGGDVCMAKGIELTDNQLEAFAGGAKLFVSNGGLWDKAKVWDKDGNILYKSQKMSDSIIWAANYAKQYRDIYTEVYIYKDYNDSDMRKYVFGGMSYPVPDYRDIIHNY